LGAKAHNFPCIVIYIPNKGVPHANVTFAGMVGSHTGVNLAGVCVAEIGDSPAPAPGSPYNLQGAHFTSMFRNILYDARRLSMATDIVERTQRIKQYHYVIGDGQWEHSAEKIQAFATDPPPNDLLIWRDNDPNDPNAAFGQIKPGIVFHDEGRGAWTDISANYGNITVPIMTTIANKIATHGSNVVNVVYDTSSLEFWVSYAKNTPTGVQEAYQRPYIRIRMNDYLP
jgi:hypothetical protein